ncbi:GcrA family cell cycle regulator [Roseibium sp.]|uniref:GcrA family cell cycle regulator n=1 Tax=Roseibium sp. TaxID=1936156 RepID=UPI003297FF11
MSLAETFFPTLWSNLTPHQKRRAVLDQLLAGRTAEEAADLLSAIYGVIGTNHVRGVMDRHRLHEQPAVKAAATARRQVERAAVRARARGTGSPVVKLRPVSRLPGARLPSVSSGPTGPKLSGKHRPKYVGLTLLQLTATTCKRPLWEDPDTALKDKFFCGRPTGAGASYCAGCARAMYRAPGEDR